MYTLKAFSEWILSKEPDEALRKRFESFDHMKNGIVIGPNGLPLKLKDMQDHTSEPSGDICTYPACHGYGKHRHVRLAGPPKRPSRPPPLGLLTCHNECTSTVPVSARSPLPCAPDPRNVLSFREAWDLFAVPLIETMMCGVPQDWYALRWVQKTRADGVRLGAFGLVVVHHEQEWRIGAALKAFRSVLVDHKAPVEVVATSSLETIARARRGDMDWVVYGLGMEPPQVFGSPT
jgi:hypothetical protein